VEGSSRTASKQRPSNRALLGSLILLALASCTRGAVAGRRAPGSEEAAGTGGGSGTAERVRFVVDERRLGEPYLNPLLGILFRPPRGWEPLPPQLMEQARAALAQPAGPGAGVFQIRLLAAFRHPQNGSLCLLSGLEPAAAAGAGPPATAETPARDIAAYVLELMDAFRGKRVEEGRFEVDVYRVVQLRIVDERSAVYKLIVSAREGAPFQIDYIIPRDALQEEIVKLESSIGSLRPAPARR
jgi:hypothetical protein